MDYHCTFLPESYVMSSALPGLNLLAMKPRQLKFFGHLMTISKTGVDCGTRDWILGAEFQLLSRRPFRSSSGLGLPHSRMLGNQ